MKSYSGAWLNHPRPRRGLYIGAENQRPTKRIELFSDTVADIANPKFKRTFIPDDDTRPLRRYQHLFTCHRARHHRTGQNFQSRLCLSPLVNQGPCCDQRRGNDGYASNEQLKFMFGRHGVRLNTFRRCTRSSNSSCSG